MTVRIIFFWQRKEVKSKKLTAELEVVGIGVHLLDEASPLVGDQGSLRAVFHNGEVGIVAAVEDAERSLHLTDRVTLSILEGEGVSTIKQQEDVEFKRCSDLMVRQKVLRSHGEKGDAYQRV